LNGQSFWFEYDKDNPKHKIYQVHDINGTRDMIGEWIQVLEMPGKRNKKVEQIDEITEEFTA